MRYRDTQRRLARAATVAMVCPCHIQAWLGDERSPLWAVWVEEVWKGHGALQQPFCVSVRDLDVDNRDSFLLEYHPAGTVVFLRDRLTPGSSSDIVELLDPPSENIVRADVELIRQLDAACSRRPRPFRDFPQSLQLEAVEEHDGVLVEAACSRFDERFFLRFVKPFDRWTCAPKAALDNRGDLPVVTEFGSRSPGSVLGNAASFCEYPPACPGCGWHSYVECPDCGALHCAPRHGVTHGGLLVPDSAEALRLRCPSCGRIDTVIHRYHSPSDREPNPHWHGDVPLTRWTGPGRPEGRPG